MAILPRLLLLLLALNATLLATDTWQGPATGNWSTGANWSDGTPPLASEAADLGSGTTITIDNASAVAASIAGTANILVPTAGTLTVNGTIIAANIAMNGGTLVNATTQCTITASTSGGTLSNIAIPSGSMLDLTQAWGAWVQASSNLTVNGSVHIGNAANTTYGVLYWTGNLSIGGTGDILLGASTNNGLGENGSGSTLTLLYPLMVHGNSGYLNSYSGTLLNQTSILCDVAAGSLTINTQTLTNQGTISSLAGGSQVNINVTGWANSGTLQAAAGSQLALHATGAGSNTGIMTASDAAITISGGTWSTPAGSSLTVNSSTLTLGGAWSAPAGAIISTGSSTINLGGTFTVTQAGLVSYASGSTTVNLTGVMDNTAGLSLTAATGPWHLLGGTINGGTITGSGADTLIGTTTGGTLSAVTLASTTVFDLTQAWGAQATITNGLTNNGSIQIGNASGSTYAVLYWTGSQAWSGSGGILAGNSTNNGIRENDSLKTLIIDSPLQIHGQSMTIYLASTSTLTNFGTIDCDVAGGTITMYGGFTLGNSGTIEATATESGAMAFPINLQIAGKQKITIDNRLQKNFRALWPFPFLAVS
jgi:fibronectin-binding autotransporter adhesin